MRLARSLVGQVEYDYLGFGSQPLNFSTPLQPPYTSNATLNVQEVKAGINFRIRAREALNSHSR